LEVERNRQEGTIAKQASEIEVFKNATKKWEDELKRSTEANGSQREELGQLTDEIRATKAKEGRRMEEVSELTDLLKCRLLHPEEVNAGQIIKRIFPESKQFPPSVKKGKLRLSNGKESDHLYDIPDGIIAHMTRE
jgi:hypothetical protein